MSILDKLNAIRQRANVYNICFRNAGVGLQFFEGPADAEERDGQRVLPENWREGLVVHRYYPSIEEAVDAEYQRICES